MDFKQAVLRCVRDKYADFSGRAERPEFWWFMLACVAVGVVLSVLHLAVIALLVNLALIVPSFSAGARRLHDTGRSGWLQLVWLIPFVGWIIMIYWLVQPTAATNEYGEGSAPADAPPLVPPGAF